MITFVMLEDATPPWRTISSRQLASLLGVSLQTLANWRVRGTGPQTAPLKKGRGNKVFYRRDAVLAWLCEDAVEPWEFCRDWLAEREITVLGVPTQESTEWLIDVVNPAYR